MNLLINEFSKKYLKQNVADLKSGDVVKVHQKIREGNKERIQVFEGVVIKIHGSKNSLDGSFTMRRISFGIGIEKTFPFHLPTIVKIEKIKSIRVRRSKLYYFRNLTDKQIRKQGELKEFEVWEEKASVEEEEKIRVEKEAEAKAKEEVKKKKQEELDKKFAQARGKVVVEEKSAESTDQSAESAVEEEKK